MGERTHAVAIPGAFMGFLQGSMIMQNPRRYDDTDEAESLGTKLREAPTRGVGRGTVHVVEVTWVEAMLLTELVEWCLDANSDEPNGAEIAAARKVRERIRAGWAND